MTAVARHTDPETSHEAAAGVDLARSQAAVLTYLRAYGPEFFTDAQIVEDYHRRIPIPDLSDSRIRTARGELASLGIVHYAGTIRRPGRRSRERVWSLDADAAMARRIETQEAAA